MVSSLSAAYVIKDAFLNSKKGCARQVLHPFCYHIRTVGMKKPIFNKSKFTRGHVKAWSDFSVSPWLKWDAGCRVWAEFFPRGLALFVFLLFGLFDFDFEKRDTDSDTDGTLPWWGYCPGDRGFALAKAAGSRLSPG